MPAPIGPGPWLPPGEQPIPLYLGNDAHKQIAEHYRTRHVNDTVFTNTTPIGSILNQALKMGHAVTPEALSDSERSLRPDITNITLDHLYEIKPHTAAAAAQTQAAMYIGIFRKAQCPAPRASRRSP